ncbi:protein SRC2 homolog [Syzygium oleosum]|uniref:protein SRC2 homolog n=1 Tax=Syzygium oleosum TaxID=219896 RepID=UPI0024BA23CF|nr:protein SRC2 homolog [Syzygium oleosum]
MDVYVVVSLSGDKNKQRTPVHKDGGASPRWGHTVVLTVDEAAARAGCLTLKFKIKAKRTLGGDKDVGRADVPVKELLERGRAAGGDGKSRAMSYSVRLPSGKTKGVLEFSYKFGEQFTVAAPRAAKKAGKPVMACPAAAVPPASSSAAAYPPPPMRRAAPYPPPAGHPPQGYWYPPNAMPGYGYAAPSPAYQQPPKKHGGGAGGLGLGLLCGLFGGLVIEDMISDC